MKIRSKTLTTIAAWMVVRGLKLLYGTCRLTIHEAEPGTCPYSPTREKFLISMWHDEILMAVFGSQPIDMAGLVSRHRDGGYLARALEMVHILPVRGSSKRGGAQAMAEMIEVTKERHIAITADGPQGPRHKAKAGIVFLASKTGRRIVPTSAACTREFRIQGSWTDMALPSPFAHMHYVLGQPIDVPTDLSREQIEEFVHLLETRMSEVQHLAKVKAGHQPAMNSETPSPQHITPPATESNQSPRQAA